ncbi:MAG: glutathione S-transferase, partial [Pseudomonadota bacterium]
PLFAHLYLDPASGELMKAMAPKVARWVERMRDAEAKPGEFLPDDAVPDTLLPILRDQFRDFVPVLTSTAAALTEWAADKQSGEEVPRALGPHAFRIGDVLGNRLIFPFNLWMLQRPLDHYRTLDADARASADAFLNEIGVRELANLDFPRLTRLNYKLALV